MASNVCILASNRDLLEEARESSYSTLSNCSLVRIYQTEDLTFDSLKVLDDGVRHLKDSQWHAHIFHNNFKSVLCIAHVHNVVVCYTNLQNIAIEYTAKASTLIVIVDKSPAFVTTHIKVALWHFDL